MAVVAARARGTNATVDPRDKVDRLLAEVIEAEAGRWASVPAAADLFADLRSCVLSPGKRLRPLFCHWGYAGVAGEGAEPATVRAGSALELLHAFALVQDDVMDGSTTRRGAPALHAVIAERHVARGWQGERRRFAEGMAVLVGDLAFAMANRLAATLPAAAQRVWHEACAELVVGQHLDLVGTVSGERDVDYAVLVATLKSGRYTVVRPLLLGAAIAAPSHRLTPTYVSYGEPLGEAFQLRDELLGAFGDPAETGKPVGEDLREGRPTLLLALAAERASDAGHRLLDRVGRPDLEDAEVEALQSLLVETGARADVEKRVARAVERSLRALDGAELHPAAVGPLRDLAEAVAWRRR